MKRAPLLEEEKLNGTIDHQFVFEFLLNLLYGWVLAPSQFGRPFHPALLMVFVAQSLEKHVVLEPPSIQPTELVKALASVSCGPLQELFGSFVQKRELGLLSFS